MSNESYEPLARAAFSPDGEEVAIRFDDEADWFIIVSSAGAYRKELPDGWSYYVPATSNDLLAEELRAANSAFLEAADTLASLLRNRIPTDVAEQD